MYNLNQKWRGAYPVFLLVLEWGGRAYNISTKPLSLSSFLGDRVFRGGLEEDPELNFDLGDMGFSTDSFSLAIACILQDVDIAKEVLKGNVLQDAKAELSYVLEKADSIQSFDNRVILIDGLVKQPIFGHNESVKGYVEFSIEAPAFFGSLYAFQTRSTGRLNPLDISSLTNTTISPFTSKFIGSSTLVDVPDAHRGKALPIVLGLAGTIIDQSGTTKRYGASPAYVIAVETTGQNACWMGIASHYVNATQVRVMDQDGKFLTGTVEHFIRSDRSVFAYINVDLKDGFLSNRLRNINEDSSAEYYISFHPNSGGGLLSRTDNSYIEGGGDICLQFLSLGSAQVDYEEWATLKPILNNYKFAGYINSTEISPLEFLENEIIPYLPISVIYGAKGLKPILNFLYEGTDLYIKYGITADSEFLQNSPIQTLTNSEDVINYYTLDYGYSLDQNKYMSTMRIVPEINFNYNVQQFSTIYSVLSGQKYGSKKEEGESNYIHDETTAALVCRDVVRFKGSVLRAVEYMASARYGYLEIGDIIRLTDSNLFDRPRVAQIIKKTWNQLNWLFTVKIEDHLQQEI